MQLANAKYLRNFEKLTIIDLVIQSILYIIKVIGTDGTVDKCEFKCFNNNQSAMNVKFTLPRVIYVGT